MKVNRLLSLGFILGLSIPFLFGQNEVDALRHSQSTINGTARSLGTGGAFSAVGADMSAGTLNPAGFGLYRSSTFTISPDLHLTNNRAQYFDSTINASDNYFGIGNWGLAFNNKTYYDNGRVREENDRGLISYTFAFGQNQLENYHRKVKASGFNPHSSISEKWANEANGTFPTNLLFDSNPELAFFLLVIDTMENRDGATYFPAVTDGQVRQTAELTEEGRRNEWFASLAGNYNNKIFVGLSVGIQSLRYEQAFNYREKDINNLYEVYDPDPDNGFPLEFPTNEIRLSETFSTRGTGINAKLGVIVRASDAFRFGLSAQTPTFLSLTDIFSTSMTHNFETDVGTEEFTEAPEQAFRYSYNMSTPFKLTAGAMFLINKSGFITADVDLIDYSTARLSDPTDALGSDSFEDANTNINNLYKQAINVRLGGELRLDIFRIRAGGALYGTPLTAEAQEYLDYSDLSTINNISGDRRIFTLGLGIRQPNFYLDVTFINQQQEDKFSPYFYDSNDFFSPTVVNNRITNRIVASVGFNF